MRESPIAPASASSPGEAPALPKREERRAVELRGYVVRADDEIVDVRVLDLSYNGCRIETSADLARDEELKLSVLARGTVTAKVRWRKGRNAGLLFISDPAAAETRPARADRVPVAAQAFLRRAGKLGYRVDAFDLSSTGCKCEFVERPEINERLWVKFRGLESLEARVSWIAGFNVGLTFSTPMHPAVFDLLVQRLGHDLDV